MIPRPHSLPVEGLLALRLGRRMMDREPDVSKGGSGRVGLSSGLGPATEATTGGLTSSETASIVTSLVLRPHGRPGESTGRPDGLPSPPAGRRPYSRGGSRTLTRVPGSRAASLLGGKCPRSSSAECRIDPISGADTKLWRAWPKLQWGIGCFPSFRASSRGGEIRSRVRPAVRVTQSAAGSCCFGNQHHVTGRQVRRATSAFDSRVKSVARGAPRGVFGCGTCSSTATRGISSPPAITMQRLF